MIKTLERLLVILINSKGVIRIRYYLTISFIAMTIGTALTITILVLSGSIKFIASEIVPISGMIVSNAMVAICLSYRSLNNEFKNRRAEVEVKLSLGADIKESSRDILRERIKLAIIPTVDSAKALGIVSLPGMMTGLILGGTSPLVAVKFQIMVTFMILSSSSLATLAATYLCYKDFFNKRMQLRYRKRMSYIDKEY